MKKYIFSLILVASSLLASSGEAVYTQHCASCHTKDMMMNKSSMMDMRKKMQNASKEEKQAMRQSMMEKMQNSDIKAPAMKMVSMRVKHMTGSKEKFVAFVKDYIQNPSQDKGYCMPMAYKRFGTMPAIGKGMSEEARDLVANWLYDNFDGSWGDSMGGKMCESKNAKNTGMKCGGMNKGGMKCASGKCGSK